MLSDHDDGLTFFMSIDGTTCPIWEPCPFSTENSSHKLGGKPGANFEIGLQINRPKLLWVYGPTKPGKYNDLMVFRQKLMGEMERLVPGRRCIGDKGYKGEPDFISTRNEYDPKELMEFKDRVLARHENFNQRLKCFECLTKMWRHKEIEHGDAFRAVCSTTVYQLETGGTTLYDPYL